MYQTLLKCFIVKEYYARKQLQLNECSSPDRNTCDTTHGFCINTPRAYTCRCRPGYLGNKRVTGHKCVSRCALPCHKNALCTVGTNPADVYCECKTGFIGNGLYCNLPNVQLKVSMQSCEEECHVHGFCDDKSRYKLFIHQNFGFRILDYHLITILGCANVKMDILVMEFHVFQQSMKKIVQQTVTPIPTANLDITITLFAFATPDSKWMMTGRVLVWILTNAKQGMV